MVPIRISSGGKLFNLMHTEENIKLQITATQNHSIAPGTIYSPRGYTIYGRIFEACDLQNIF